MPLCLSIFFYFRERDKGDMKKSIVLLTIFFLQGSAISTVFSDESKDTSEDFSFLIFPAFVYSTDTGFGAGLASLKSYNPNRVRISTMQFFGIYTQKKQITTALKFDHYFQGGADRISIGFQYEKFPTYFFGIGNNTSNKDPEKYTPENFTMKFFYERRIIKHFRIKTHFVLHNQSLINAESNGMIRSSFVPWSSGRFDAGPGISLLWDSRDNTIATKCGILGQIEYFSFMLQDKGGSFNSLSLDVRTFINPFHDTVLGCMVLYKDTRGDVPFYMFSKLGGNDRLRGYELDRFSDRSMLLMQQDFRYPIWGPLGGAVFFATARVANDVVGLFSGNYHTGYGTGIRYYFNKESNLVVRFDAALGSDSRGYYVTFGEAF